MGMNGYTGVNWSTITSALIGDRIVLTMPVMSAHSRYASREINFGCTAIGYSSSDIDLVYTVVRYARLIPLLHNRWVQSQQ